MEQKKKISRQKLIIISLVVVLCGVGTVVGLYFAGVLTIGGPSAEPTTGDSTFKITCYTSGEDVSNFLELSVWTPKDSATFDTTEDIYTMTNYEETKSSLDADDISIDLTDYPYVWVETDPDAETVFSSHFYLIPGGANNDYTLKAYDQSTDVNFNILDANLAAISIVLDNRTHTTGNYTAIFDVPHCTTTVAQLHYGTGWVMSATDFADLSQTQKNEYYKEELWAGQFPYYSPVVDTYKNPKYPLEGLTNAFCFKLVFNESISSTAGVSSVNLTLSSDVNAEVVTSGENLYIIYYTALTFKNGAQASKFEMQTGTGICLTDCDSGRIIVPKGGSALSTFTKYSDIAT